MSGLRHKKYRNKLIKAMGYEVSGVSQTQFGITPSLYNGIKCEIMSFSKASCTRSAGKRNEATLIMALMFKIVNV